MHVTQLYAEKRLVRLYKALTKEAALPILQLAPACAKGLSISTTKKIRPVKFMNEIRLSLPMMSMSQAAYKQPHGIDDRDRLWHLHGALEVQGLAIPNHRSTVGSCRIVAFSGVVSDLFQNWRTNSGRSGMRSMLKVMLESVHFLSSVSFSLSKLAELPRIHTDVYLPCHSYKPRWG
jgi:hypothetical protein